MRMTPELRERMKTRKQARTAKAKLLGHRRRSKGIRAKKLWLKVDMAASRGFLDRRSKVMLDGREILHGADMSARRRFVLIRDSFMCRKCFRGGDRDGEGLELDHILPRSKGRDDRASNLQILCRWCHEAKHGRTLRWARKERRG